MRTELEGALALVLAACGRGPASGDSRVLRGGSWHSDPDLARSASRGWGAPTARYTAIGFRVAASAAPPH